MGKFVNKNKSNTNMENLENWRDIEGYEGKYQVSNLGRVRSLSGRWGEYKEPKILKVGKSGKGYLYVGLHKDGKVKNFYVHRLVCQAFIPNPQNVPEVNHKDENKENNNVDNLEWCDHKYNINYGTCIERHAEKHRGFYNTKKSKAIISTDEFGNKEYFPSAAEAKRRYGFSESAIGQCVKGKIKTHKGRTWRYADC